MTKFKGTYIATVTFEKTFEVEAEDKEDARHKIREQAFDEAYGCYNLPQGWYPDWKDAELMGLQEVKNG